MRLFGLTGLLERLHGRNVLSSLVLRGEIASGMKCYSDMVFPHTSGFDDAPDDLPDTFYPGSLNINIYRDGFPSGVRDIQDLDKGILRASFAIAHDAIGNNMLSPTATAPQRGTMLFWPAAVTLDETGHSFNAWAARRIGSAYYNVAELMSDIKLRDAHDLKDGMAVTLTLSAKP